MLPEPTLRCSGHLGLRQLSFFTSRGLCRRENCVFRNWGQTLPRTRVRRRPPTLNCRSTFEVPNRGSVDLGPQLRHLIRWQAFRDGSRGRDVGEHRDPRRPQLVRRIDAGRSGREVTTSTVNRAGVARPRRRFREVGNIPRARRVAPGRTRQPPRLGSERGFSCRRRN